MNFIFNDNVQKNMYVYCVYPVISKDPKQLPHCLKIAEISVVLSVFKGVICYVSVYILLPFLAIAQHESGTRKAIFWSVTVYNKNVSSQCNLAAQIEPVHDKIVYGNNMNIHLTVIKMAVI
jgi:hypothetical protein